MKLGKTVFVAAVYLLSVNAEIFDNFIEDYCWRDYDGIIPADALKAGTDRQGRPIYIGQTLLDDKLIPGKIHENIKEIHIEFWEVFVVNETIKILCTQYPEKFEWFATSNSEILNIKDKHLFEGGFEKDLVTYVGRASSNGEVTVGKVMCWPTDCIPLTTIDNGTFSTHYEFEILTYNPNAVVKSKKKTDDYSEAFSSQPSVLSYFLLVLVTAVLIVLVVLAIRRC